MPKKRWNSPHVGTPVDLARRTLPYYPVEILSDLEQAFVLSREALELCPCGHPFRPQTLSDFAIRQTPGNRLGEIGDLEEAIILSREAVKFLPCGHPVRSNSLIYLARYLRTRFAQLCQIKDQDELFSLYSELAHTAQTVSSTDLSAAKEWVCVAEEFVLATNVSQRSMMVGRMDGNAENLQEA